MGRELRTQPVSCRAVVESNVWLGCRDGQRIGVEIGVAMDFDIAAGLLCRQGRFLLGKRSGHRNAYPGMWDLPGGHVEAGEKVEQALVRELGEELGVIPGQWRKLVVLRAGHVR